MRHELSEETKILIAKQDGSTIKYYDDLSEELQLAAVNQNGSAIKYIKCASKELQIASLWKFKVRKYVKIGLELPTTHLDTR